MDLERHVELDSFVDERFRYVGETAREKKIGHCVWLAAERDRRGGKQLSWLPTGNRRGC